LTFAGEQRRRVASSAHPTNPIRFGKVPASDDKDLSSNLYTRYADLSAGGLGTAEQRITLRGERQQNLAGD